MDAVAANAELKAANERLRDELAQPAGAEGGLQLALEGAGMGSWELHLGSRQTVRSLRYDQIFGHRGALPHWSLDDTLGHFRGEARDRLAQAFAEAERRGLIDIEESFLTAGGEERWVHFNGSTFYADGHAMRIVGVLSDVTHRHSVEERLRQAQKIEALGQLAGGVAHDFNNLLQVIAGGLQVITKQSEPRKRDQLLNVMRQSVDRGDGLCRQLLAFSRTQPLTPEPVELRSVITGMRELLHHSLRGDIAVRCDFEEGLWPVEVDPGELELVLLNLAVNARDAMPKGGTINLAARNIVDFEDQGLRGDYVRLDVTDSGTGMPPDVLAHAFEPFFTTKEVGRGSGLGLAQAHGFARASGGLVRIETAIGEGTTVSLFLPRTRKTPRAVPDHFEPRLDAALSGQVLLVEDDDEVAALTVEMIQQLGYATTRVASAEAALGALADRRAVDIVFSDVMMPGRMNGVELAQEIRRRRPDLPVLLTSGYADAAGRHAAAHRIRIISKPYGLDQLRDALAAASQDARNSAREH